MDSIFLTPETTFPVSIKPEKDEAGRLSFKITDGGPYTLRTATGREFGRIQQAVGRSDIDASYGLLPSFLGGIDPKDIEKLHPQVVQFLLIEILSRSKVSETEAGK